MLKKLFSVLPFVLILGLIINLNSETYAKEVHNFGENVEKAKFYIENSVNELNEILSSMRKDSNSEDIKAAINNYYSENPVHQDILNDNTLTIDDIFPLDENQETVQSSEVINLGELALQAKGNLTKDEFIYEFFNENGVTTVYLSKTGGLIITEGPAPLLDLSRNKLVTAATDWNVTKTQRTTGAIYNSFGSEMAQFWAEGNFKYNGIQAVHSYADGGIERKLAGSTLNIEKKAEGKTRTNAVGSYSYPEVYTQVYFEAQLGFRYLGITVTSATLEAYVGAGPSGSLYGQVIKK